MRCNINLIVANDPTRWGVRPTSNSIDSHTIGYNVVLEKGRNVRGQRQWLHWFLNIANDRRKRNVRKVRCGFCLLCSRSLVFMIGNLEFGPGNPHLGPCKAVHVGRAPGAGAKQVFNEIEIVLHHSQRALRLSGHARIETFHHIHTNIHASP